MANRGLDINNLVVKSSQAELQHMGEKLRDKVSFDALGTFKHTQRDPTFLMQRISDMLVPELLPERYRHM
ncbi:MAG TPA: DUF2252 domain-containing protein, partial [Lactobacillus sp.]|nr:DUF2252 domain-containing protein [Lactobacillus sp.]